MLVLTRKPEEALLIGSESDATGVVTVKVLSIVGNRVKLGLTMNRGVSVFRSEVWQRLQGESLADKT